MEYKEIMEEVLIENMAALHIPGLALSLVEGGEVVYRDGFGSATMDKGVPVTPDTLFGIGSCTKSFTSLSILQLAQDGKLNVQDPVENYIPCTPGGKGRAVTIHDLLTMSSGLPNLGVAEFLIGQLLGIDGKSVPLASRQDLYRHVQGAQREQVDGPGEKMFYFNTGYTLLAHIVEEVAQISFPEYVKNNILKPLAMERSTFLEEEFLAQEDRITPYRVKAEGGNVEYIPSPYPFHDHIYGPGGLMSSVEDMARYVLANLKTGSLLEPAYEDLFHDLHIAMGPAPYPAKVGAKRGYGYGWMVDEDFLGHRLIHHGGSTGVSGAFIAFIPALNIGVAAAVNCGYAPPFLILSALMALKGHDPRNVLPDLRLRREMQSLTGTYATYRGINEVQVENKGAMLHMIKNSGDMSMSYPLIPRNHDQETRKYYIYLRPGQRECVDFVPCGNCGMDLYMERNRYHKQHGPVEEKEEGGDSIA